MIIMHKEDIKFIKSTLNRDDWLPKIMVNKDLTIEAIRVISKKVMSSGLIIL